MSGLLDQDSAANLLGIPPKDLQKLARDGVIKRQDGKFHPVTLVRDYVAHVKSEGEGKKFLSQIDGASKLDMSERNYREVLRNLNLDHKTVAFEVIAIEYIRDLREKAAGRGGEEQAAQTQARTREAIANAKLKELAYEKEMGTLILSEDIEPLLIGWATSARSEVQFAIEKIVSGIESEHSIKVDQGLIDGNLRHAYGAIAAYPEGLQENDEEDSGSLVAAS